MAASRDEATTSRAHRVGLSARRYRKVSVTLPADLLDQIRERVGPGNLSRYVTEALEAEQRRQALQEFVHHMEAEHGPPSEEDLAEARRRLQASTEDG